MTAPRQAACKRAGVESPDGAIEAGKFARPASSATEAPVGVAATFGLTPPRVGTATPPGQPAWGGRRGGPVAVGRQGLVGRLAVARRAGCT